MDIKKLLDERQQIYGDTWFEVGAVIHQLMKPFLHFAEQAPYLVHNWIIMLSKMIRILHSPYKIDHWRDIAGYSTLIADYLEDCNDEVSSK